MDSSLVARMESLLVQVETTKRSLAAKEAEIDKTVALSQSRNIERRATSPAVSKLQARPTRRVHATPTPMIASHAPRHEPP